MSYGRCAILPLMSAIFSLCGPATFAQITQPYTVTDYQTSHKKLEIFSRQLFSGVEFRDVLDKLSAAADVAIWLDRRVDPSQRIDLQSDEQSFAETISELNLQTATQSVWLGGLLYVAPTDKAVEIQYAFWLAATNANQELLHRRLQTRHWSTPIEPSQLIANIASEAGIKLSNLSAIQHDVWRAGDLPSNNAAAVLTALLAGFEQRVDFENGQFSIVPMLQPPEKLAWAYDPRWLASLASPRKYAWEQKWQNAIQWKQSGNATWLNAPLQAHRELATDFASTDENLRVGIQTAKTAGKKPAKALRESRQRFTLRLRGRLVDVLPPLLANLQLDSDVAAMPPQLQEKTVDISVEGVTLNELLAAIAQSAGIQISLVDASVHIFQ